VSSTIISTVTEEETLEPTTVVSTVTPVRVRAFRLQSRWSQRTQNLYGSSIAATTNNTALLTSILLLGTSTTFHNKYYFHLNKLDAIEHTTHIHRNTRTGDERPSRDCFRSTYHSDCDLDTFR